MPKNTNVANSLNRLLNDIATAVKKGKSNRDIYQLRAELFEELQKQADNKYSKLAEINEAFNKVSNEYKNNKNINIIKEFIKALGYNGFYLEGSQNNVIYDVNKKKEKLLDYSKERAKARLDKAIAIFGETHNPKKAGWLLSDGRLVNHNRDSSNILGEGENWVLDYQDHFQIEKVFEKRRGYDAIDAFMAEGNIRLMPEAGGIEIRNKPNFKQEIALKQYIDSVIDEHGIELDLRKPGTTENEMPYYVRYDSTKSAKTIINDIYSYYENGKVSRVIEGQKYALKENVEEIVLKEYGTTSNWRETGYLLKDGTMLDLSGKNQGAPRNQRSIDHREIFDGDVHLESNEDYSGTNDMVEFMSRGNIRVSPEYPGLNIQVEPTESQYKKIQDFVERIGFKEEYFSIDFDDARGNVVDTLEYEGKVSGRKVVDDIKYFFKNGKVPYKSELSDFRYSLKDIEKYTKNQYNYFGWVKVNDVLTPNEYTDFNQKIRKLTADQRMNRTINNEIMVAVNDMKGVGFGVDNTIVFYKGSFFNPQITRVIKIDLDNETDIEIIRSDIYERETRTKQTRGFYQNLYGETLIREFTNEDVRSYQELKTEWWRQRSRENGRENNSNNQQFQNRTRDTEGDRKNPEFSLKENSDYRFTPGQVNKIRANYHNEKVYSKEDAQKIVNNILTSDILEIEDKFGTMKGKTKAETIDRMFEVLNKVEPGMRADLVKDMAEYIVNNATYEDIFESEDLSEPTRIYETLKEYRGKLNLDYIKDEIRHKYDSSNTVYAQWGKRKGESGIGVDSAVEELRERGVNIEASNPADQLFEIIDLYKDSLDKIKNKVTQWNADSLEETSKNEKVNQIVNEIYDALDKYGEESKHSKEISKFTERIKQLSDKVKTQYVEYKVKESLMTNIEKVREIRDKKYQNAGELFNDQINALANVLSGVKYKNDIRKSQTRERIADFGKFVIDNEYFTENLDKSVLEDLKSIMMNKDSTKELSIEELKTINNIVKNFIHIAKEFDTIFRNGGTEKLSEISQKGYDVIKHTPRFRQDTISKYLNTALVPRVLFERLDNFSPNGVLTSLRNDILNGETKANSLFMKFKESFDDFYKNNKGYEKSLFEKVDFCGHKITKIRHFQYICYLKGNKHKAIFMVMEFLLR